MLEWCGIKRNIYLDFVPGFWATAPWCGKSVSFFFFSLRVSFVY